MKPITQTIFFVMALLWASQTLAQEKKLKLSGNAGVYGDFYDFTTNNPNGMLARRPPFSGRLIVNLALQYKNFSLPVSLSLANKQFSTVYPVFPSENLWLFISNPSNRVGISPKYKWIEVQLGTFTPSYSELTLGDVPIFGAGIQLTPKAFRFSICKGISKPLVASDSSKSILGSYQQQIMAAKLGFGREEKSHLYLIAAIMQEDTSQAKKIHASVRATECRQAAIHTRMNFGKKLWIGSEVSTSAFTRDLNSIVYPSDELPVQIPKNILQIRSSTRLDYAGMASINKEGEVFACKIQLKYLGDGFVPVGYPMMQTDRMDLTISPRFNLGKGKFIIQGSIGQRVNNLSKDKLAQATQTLGSLNFSATLSESFSVAGTYSNFGFKNSIENDTFKINLVNLSYGISPVLMLKAKKSMHLLSLNLGYDAFTDFNVLSGKMNDNKVQSIFFIYAISGKTKSYRLSFTISYLNNTLSIGELSNTSAGFQFSYPLAKKKLKLLVGTTYTESGLKGELYAIQLIYQGGLQYDLSKKLSFKLQGNSNQFVYGSSLPGVWIQENYLKTSLHYQF